MPAQNLEKAAEVSLQGKARLPRQMPKLFTWKREICLEYAEVKVKVPPPDSAYNLARPGSPYMGEAALRLRSGRSGLSGAPQSEQRAGHAAAPAPIAEL
jgi:hypothetical protein